MRRSLTVCRSGLSVAAAVVLLTACGGSDGEDSASSESSASSSSAAETTAGASDSEFCTEAAAALAKVEPAFSGSQDPAALAPALQQAADDVRAIDAPPDIAEDWTALGDGIEQFAEAFAEVDVNDPASAAAFQQRTTEIVGELTASATTVQNYLADECGLDPTETDPAAPTS
jgi:ABC-type phosphate transport system substrate-binding protein